MSNGNSLPALITPDQVDLIAKVDAIEGTHASLETLTAIAATLPKATFQPIAAACNTSYHARHYSGLRPLSEIHYIVMHCTQGSTAAAAASWFANPASAGSAHLVIDDNVCYRTLPNEAIPWGAPGANYRGFHIEQAGYVNWTAYIWGTTHHKELERAAYKAAVHCKLFSIPVRFLDATALKAGQRGITTHMQCTKAFGGDHTDPGPFWPTNYFLKRVAYWRERV
jgi:hypothetical protein